MKNARYEYVIYIATSPKTLWNALVDAKVTRKYWQHANVSDWKPGSRWEHQRDNKKGTVDMVGTVVECSAPRRMVLTWADPADEARKEKHSRVTLKIEQFRNIARLTVVHDRLAPESEMLEAISDGWPKVLCSLKSLMERGQPLPKLW